MLSAGYLLFDRYSKNTTQIVPYPYAFSTNYPATNVEAPIIIVGDRMGEYFARFKEQLSVNISVDLDNAIKIQSLAKSGFGIHRSLHQLKALNQWPQIILYHGGSEEFSETKFDYTQLTTIKENFKLFNDDRIQTLLVFFPELSRLIYNPIKKVLLDENLKLNSDLEEKEFLKKIQTELMLYEQHLNDLVSLSRDRNSLIILMTTPFNLDSAPKKTCSFTTTPDLEKKLESIKEELRDRNPKSAYSKSAKLIEKTMANASLYYLHGQISKRLGMKLEAIDNLLKASTYDCTSWRATEVQNAIIRKVANEQKVILFDFAKLVERDFVENTTFFDDLYPQNLYYEKAAQQLGLVIKSILKL